MAEPPHFTISPVSSQTAIKICAHSLSSCLASKWVTWAKWKHELATDRGEEKGKPSLLALVWRGGGIAEWLPNNRHVRRHQSQEAWDEELPCRQGFYQVDALSHGSGQVCVPAMTFSFLSSAVYLSFDDTAGHRLWKTVSQSIRAFAPLSVRGSSRLRQLLNLSLPKCHFGGEGVFFLSP